MRRVLCLHGGGSRAEILRYQLRPLFAATIAKGMELHYECVDGHIATPGDEALEVFFPGNFYSFVNRTKKAANYQSKDLYPPVPLEDGPGAYVRLPAAIEAIRDFFLSEEGGVKYEGIVGFSQGANVAAMLLSLIHI